MRLRAGFILLCLMLAGCQHLPEGVKVDVATGVVEVGPCRCALPKPKAEPAPPALNPAPEPADEPAADAGDGQPR